MALVPVLHFEVVKILSVNSTGHTHIYDSEYITRTLKKEKEKKKSKITGKMPTHKRMGPVNFKMSWNVFMLLLLPFLVDGKVEINVGVIQRLFFSS